MIYELINPGDVYTFEAVDDAVATTLCPLVSAMVAWERVDEDDDRVSGPPPAALMGQKESDRVAEECKAVIADRRPELIEALRSLEIDRERRLRLGFTDIEAWHEEHRTSSVDLRYNALVAAGQLEAIGAATAT